MKDHPEMNNDQCAAMEGVAFEVCQERHRQHRTWGEQDHEPAKYFAILAEEHGEAAKEVVEYSFLPKENRTARLSRVHKLRAELVQEAAVAIAWIEALDRNEISELEGGK